jgi:deoxyribodipyrimidine photolyase-related protein
MTARKMRHLVLVLGDRLGSRSVAFEGFDPSCDRILMAEVVEESEHVPSARMRTALFRSAMRHFAEELTARAWPFDYLRLGALWA